MGPVVVRRGLRCQAVGEAAVVVQVEGAWLRCPGASGPPGDASVLDSPAAHNKANGTELWAGAVYSTWEPHAMWSHVQIYRQGTYS